MYSKCMNLRIRTKQGVKYLYCLVKHRKIERNDCIDCDNKEYKKVPKMAVKTKIKPVSKKRKCVSKKTYNEVFERCGGKCALCETTLYLEYHHIYFRSERPDLIDDPDNGIMLCGEFANNCHKGKAHKQKRVWQPILLRVVHYQKTGEVKLPSDE